MSETVPEPRGSGRCCSGDATGLAADSEGAVDRFWCDRTHKVLSVDAEATGLQLEAGNASKAPLWRRQRLRQLWHAQLQLVHPAVGVR